MAPRGGPDLNNLAEFNGFLAQRKLKFIGCHTVRHHIQHNALPSWRVR